MDGTDNADIFIVCSLLMFLCVSSCLIKFTESNKNKRTAYVILYFTHLQVMSQFQHRVLRAGTPHSLRSRISVWVMMLSQAIRVYGRLMEHDGD